MTQKWFCKWCATDNPWDVVPCQSCSYPRELRPGETAPVAPPPQPAAPPPEPAALLYGDTIDMPQLCACCTAPPTTTVATQAVHLTTKKTAWFKFPYCAPCASHIRWSGAPGTGAMRVFGTLGTLGGAAAFLSLPGHGGGGLGTAVLLAFGGGLGYLAMMIFVAIIGRGIALSHAECTGRSGGVVLGRGAGGFRFRFTNPKFDQAFRSQNQGYPETDTAALIRRMNQEKRG